MERIGWWHKSLGHDYKRRSVKHQYRDWPGWKRFMLMFEGTGIKTTPYLADSRKYATILFETGCRIAEGVQLKRDMFTWNEEAIMGWDVPVLKKKEEENPVRRIMIKLDDHNPLGFEFVEYLEASKEGEYLLPGLKRFSREEEPWRHASIKTAYNRITELHPDFFPHILRGYRAGMLVNERGFSIRELMGWFDWKSTDMAVHYTKIRDMAAAMGIKNVPQGLGGSVEDD